jgi:hypothetical protein
MRNYRLEDSRCRLRGCTVGRGPANELKARSEVKTYLVAVGSVIAELLARAYFVPVAVGVLVAVDDPAKSELVAHRNLKRGTAFVNFLDSDALVGLKAKLVSFQADNLTHVMRVGSSVAAEIVVKRASLRSVLELVRLVRAKLVAENVSVVFFAVFACEAAFLRLKIIFEKL